MAVRFVNAEVVGYRPYSFTGSDGKIIDMVQVFATYDDNRVQGYASCAFNVSNNKFLDNGIALGKEVKIIFAEKRWQYVGTV